MTIDWFGNIALTLDNKLGRDGVQTKISNNQDFTEVYQFRNNLAGIVVGSNTILTDNPSLMTKPQYLEQDQEISHPIPVIFDRRGRISEKAKIFDSLSTRPVIWVTNNENIKIPKRVHVVPYNSLKQVIEEVQMVLHSLSRYGPVMVEGGAMLMKEFIEKSIINKIRIFTSEFSLPQSELQLFFPDNFVYNLISVLQLSSGYERIYRISEKTNQ